MARLPPAAAYALSAALHAAAFVALARTPALTPRGGRAGRARRGRAAPARRPHRPRPARSRRARRRAARRSSAGGPAAPRRAPEAPPPPNEPPPPEAPPAARAPVHIGISMSSATTSGGIAAPVGNTLYGELPRRAPEPAEVRPYQAERYVPPTQVTVLPRPLGECVTRRRSTRRGAPARPRGEGDPSPPHRDGRGHRRRARGRGSGHGFGPPRRGR